MTLSSPRKFYTLALVVCLTLFRLSWRGVWVLRWTRLQQTSFVGHLGPFTMAQLQYGADDVA